MMATLIIAILAAGHGASAAYLLRHLKHKPRTNLRRWQVACLVFPAAVILVFWLGNKKGEINPSS